MRIKAKQIYLEINKAFFQFSELFMLDNTKLLGYEIACYHKHKEDIVKLLKNIFKFKGCATSTANISKLGVSDLIKVCTFNTIFNGSTGEWLRNPSQLILAKRVCLEPINTNN